MSMSTSMTACGDYGSIDHLALSAGLYHLCAAVHHAALPVPTGVWERLGTVQRNLWFIDEIEARWQRIVTQARSARTAMAVWCAARRCPKRRLAARRKAQQQTGIAIVRVGFEHSRFVVPSAPPCRATQYPRMGRHVIEWCTYDDYDAQLPDYAHLIGGPGLAPQDCADTTSHHKNWTDVVYNDSVRDHVPVLPCQGSVPPHDCVPTPAPPLADDARGRASSQYVASRDEEYALLMGLKEVVDGSTVWTVKAQSVLATQQAVLCP
jgi:hypothetical protein